MPPKPPDRHRLHDLTGSIRDWFHSVVFLCGAQLCCTLKPFHAPCLPHPANVQPILSLCSANVQPMLSQCPCSLCSANAHAAYAQPMPSLCYCLRCPANAWLIPQPVQPMLSKSMLSQCLKEFHSFNAKTGAIRFWNFFDLN